jgi:hypothetical protein
VQSGPSDSILVTMHNLFFVMRVTSATPAVWKFSL